MKYTLQEKEISSGSYTFERELDGFVITPKKGKTTNEIDIKEVVIVDYELIDKHAKKAFDKKIKELTNLMLIVLNSDDSTDDGASIVLDEVSKLKSIIINKYKKYITDSLYKNYMKKIIILEEEFKRNFMYNKYYMESENKIVRGRSR
mgnify:CR=1 FL=1